MIQIFLNWTQAKRSYDVSIEFECGIVKIVDPMRYFTDNRLIKKTKRFNGYSCEHTGKRTYD